MRSWAVARVYGGYTLFGAKIIQSFLSNKEDGGNKFSTHFNPNLASNACKSVGQLDTQEKVTFSSSIRSSNLCG